MSNSAQVQRYLDLVYKYKDDIYRIIYNVIDDHYIAEELTQIVLINAWKGFGSLKNPAKSKAWVKAITRNAIREYMRKKKIYLSLTERKFITDIEEIDTLASIEKDILEAIVEREDIKRVLTALNSMDEKYRMVIKEHLIGHITLKDIAEVHGMNPGSVRVIYSRGMKLLREAYMKLEKGDRVYG